MRYFSDLMKWLLFKCFYQRYLIENGFHVDLLVQEHVAPTTIPWGSPAERSKEW